MPLYVYALADVFALPTGLTGWNGEPLALVHAGQAVAVVTAVERPPEATLESLRQQDALVRALLPATAALLPARFGSVLADVAAVASRLARNPDGLASALERVRGREQMTLRLVTRAAGAGERAEASPDAASPGRRYLEQRSARRIRPEALAAFEEALEPLVRARRIDESAAEASLATVHHLVEIGEGDAYRACVAALSARRADVAVRVSGPGPAYAFARDTDI